MEQKEIKHFEVDVNLMNEITQYLANKPYIEVAGIIQKLNTGIIPKYKEDSDKMADKPVKKLDSNSKTD